MLCERCRPIFYGKLPIEPEACGHGWASTITFTHHPHWQSLLDSLETGCQLCTSIWYGFAPTTRKALRRASDEANPELLSSEHPLQSYVSTFEPACSVLVQGEQTPSHKLHIDTELSWNLTFYRVANNKDCDRDGSSDDLKHVPSRTTGDELTWILARKWIKTCTEHHDHCSQRIAAESFHFARILDVDSMCIREVIEIPPGSLYTTLSHCWGGLDLPSLKTDKYEQMKRQIDPTKLPKTFTHAIECTRALGIKLLWIDSLCIVQDSEDDWNREAAHMGGIYAGSYCNIAATSALNGRGGLYRDRYLASASRFTIGISRPLTEPGTDNIDGTSNEVLRIPEGLYEAVNEELWENLVSKSPLGGRAWFTQERLLAPRVLHFSWQQILWECQDLRACESHPEGLHKKAQGLADIKKYSPFSDKLVQPESCSVTLLETWMNVIELYSGGRLTRSTDKAAAIAGVATVLSMRTGVQYYAGIFDVFLPCQLTWMMLQPPLAVPEARAPSWSWMSVDSSVVFKWAPMEMSQMQMLVKVIDINIEILEGISPFLRTTNGEMLLQGHLTPCECANDWFRSEEEDHDRPSTDVMLRIRGHVQNARVNLDRARDIGFGNLFVVPFLFNDKTVTRAIDNLQAFVGLILEATGENGTFRRIGLFDQPLENGSTGFGDVCLKWTRETDEYLPGPSRVRDEVDERYYVDYLEEDDSGYGRFVFKIV